LRSSLISGQSPPASDTLAARSVFASPAARNLYNGTFDTDKINDATIWPHKLNALLAMKLVFGHVLRHRLVLPVLPEDAERGRIDSRGFGNAENIDSISLN
jgi:hypothetical protein